VFTLQMKSPGTTPVFVRGTSIFRFTERMVDADIYEGRSLTLAVKNLRSRFPKSVITVLTVCR
jgi:hypothetical protein